MVLLMLVLCNRHDRIISKFLVYASDHGGYGVEE